MIETDAINWGSIKVVIFDVDGTLYRQSKLRKKMLFALFSYYITKPLHFQDLAILYSFRKEREKNSKYLHGNLEQAQYEWCSKKSGHSVLKVRQVVDKWIFKVPNKYLLDCLYPGTSAFFDALRRKRIKIAIYSDYDSLDKLDSMKLKADLVVSSTDKEVDRIKPDPAGLLYIVKKFHVKPSECLFIGDREELDGQCAKAVNMPYIILNKEGKQSYNFYHSLINLLNTHNNYNAP